MASSKDPLLASLAARRRSPWEYCSLGRFSSAIGGAQVAVTAPPVGKTRDADVPEDRGQGAGLVPDGVGAWHAPGVDDRRDGLLAQGPQLHAVLQELPQHLSPLPGKQVLQVGMRHVVAVRHLQARHQFVELAACGGSPSLSVRHPFRPPDSRGGVVGSETRPPVSTVRKHGLSGRSQMSRTGWPPRR